MKGDAGGPFQIAIDDDADLPIAIVDQAEGRHRTRRQSQMRHEPVRRRKTEFAVTDLIGHRA